MRVSAAGLVLVSHLALAGSFAGPVSASMGQVGVNLFFVLSGYLVPRVWAARPDRRYALGRIARIAPGYWLAAVGLALVAPGWQPASLLMLQPIDLTRVDAGFLAVVWTLRVELVFYALVPLLARLGTRPIVVLGCASYAAALAVWAGGGSVNDLASPPLRLWEFLPGLLLARLALRPLPPVVLAVGVALVLGAIGLGLTAVDLVSVGGAGLVAAWAVSHPALRLPSVIGAGAAISYGVYLWHRELLYALAPLPLPLLALAGITLTIGVATASWLGLERPVLRAQKRAEHADRALERGGRLGVRGRGEPDVRAGGHEVGLDGPKLGQREIRRDAELRHEQQIV
jgi:peptidoglycan/LPS O-acetylase OafA/YrhL